MGASVRRTLVAVLFLASTARASPVSPLTLWELVERADLIVLADVEGVDRLGPGAGGEDWNTQQARLRVVERWKGEGPPELTVGFPGNLTCPAPPRFDHGRRVLAFLGREHEEWAIVGLASGTRYPPTPDQVTAYRTAVGEAVGLQDPRRSRPTSTAERRAWQLRRVATPATRWDGLSGLRLPPTAWTDEERAVLARALVEDPPVDETLRTLLRALQPSPDPAVTTAAVSAFDAVLKLPRVPGWADEVLDLLRVRLAGDGPPKAPVDPIQTFAVVSTAQPAARPARDQNRIRADWVDLKEHLRLAPQPLRRASGVADAAAGASCDSLLEAAEVPGRREVLEPVSMLRVARSCAVTPQAVTSWFPRHQLKMVMEVARSADPDRVERVVGPRRCEVGAVLWSFHEPVLTDRTEGEAYRVVWRPSFAPPVVFRVERAAGGARAVLKRDRMRGEALSGRYDVMVREVSDADFDAVRRAAEAAECWRPAHSCRAELSVEPGRVTVDGDSWLLEGARTGEHWSVDVDDPRSGPFLDVAMAVVRAGHGEPWLTRPPAPATE